MLISGNTSGAEYSALGRVSSWKLEAGSWKLEAGSWKLEAGSWKLEEKASGCKRQASNFKFEFVALMKRSMSVIKVFAQSWGQVKKP